MSNFWFDWFVNHKTTPIIRPVKSELLADMILGGLPALVQACRSSGPSMMTTLILDRPLLFMFFSGA